MEHGGGYYVKHCIFIAKHNVFVISLNDKYKRSSKLEIHAFRSTEVVRDSYVIKGKVPDIDTPFVARSYSFTGCLGQKPVLTQYKDEIDENYKNIVNTEKLLEYLFDSSIKVMVFCHEPDILSIGFRDGKIQSFFVNISTDKNNFDEDQDSDGEEENKGTLLMKKAFE
jgi:hypothetical protein